MVSMCFGKNFLRFSCLLANVFPERDFCWPFTLFPMCSGDTDAELLGLKLKCSQFARQK